MFNKNDILDLMTLLPKFHNTVTDKDILYNDIKNIEIILNIELPNSFKLFMQNYGFTSFYGFEIYGLISSDI